MHMIERKGDYDTWKRKGNPVFKNSTTVFPNLSTTVAIDMSVDKPNSKIQFTYFLQVTLMFRIVTQCDQHVSAERGISNTCSWNYFYSINILLDTEV